MAQGKNPYEILREYSQTIVDALRKSLVDNERYKSGGLAKSIEAKVVFAGQAVVLQVFMDGYWKFVDEGVSGRNKNRNSPYKFKKKNIPKDAMLKHIANSGISSKDIEKFYTNKKGLKVQRKKPLAAQKARNTLAFLIGRKISSQGLEKTNFVEEGLDGIVPKLEADLLEAVGREIEISLNLK